MANPRMYNPNSNMAATLSQFNNPAEIFMKNIVQPGGILSEQINRMSQGEAQGLNVINSALNNSFRNKQLAQQKELSLAQMAQREALTNKRIAAANARASASLAASKKQYNDRRNDAINKQKALIDAMKLNMGNSFSDTKTVSELDPNKILSAAAERTTKLDRPISTNNDYSLFNAAKSLTPEEIDKQAKQQAINELNQKDPYFNDPNNLSTKAHKLARYAEQHASNLSSPIGMMNAAINQGRSLYDQITDTRSDKEKALAELNASTAEQVKSNNDIPSLADLTKKYKTNALKLQNLKQQSNKPLSTQEIKDNYKVLKALPKHEQQDLKLFSNQEKLKSIDERKQDRFKYLNTLPEGRAKDALLMMYNDQLNDMQNNQINAATKMQDALLKRKEFDYQNDAKLTNKTVLMKLKKKLDNNTPLSHSDNAALLKLYQNYASENDGIFSSPLSFKEWKKQVLH